MWISKEQYNRIMERLAQLENHTYMPTGHPDAQLGRTVSKILDYLGLTLERPLPYDKLVKKGGPERGD